MEEQQQSAIIKLFKYPNKARHIIANVHIDLDFSKFVILCSMGITIVFSQTGKGYRMRAVAVEGDVQLFYKILLGELS